MAQEPVVNTWPGTSTFAPGMTPFGYYDSDTSFASDADKVASWCAGRLGFPIVDVELIDKNFYAAFEEAISEYGNYVNTFSAKDIILDVKGSPIANLNFTGNYVESSGSGVFKLAKQYGIMAPAGQSVNWYKGKILVSPDKQTYSLKDDALIELEEGDPTTDIFTIRKVFHNRPPASLRQAGGASMGYGGSQSLLNEFGFRGVPNDYLMTPLNFDAQIMQAIELNDMLRKSSYTFKIQGDRIKIFPVPKSSGVIYFEYTLDNEDHLDTAQSEDIISDPSNIPYQNIKYSKINSIGKQWIKRYTLALCKEMLGLIRGKYSQIPIPGNEIDLNSEDLLGQASEEKQTLLEELTETLESFSNRSQMQRRAEEAEALETHISGVPLKMYIR